MDQSTSPAGSSAAGASAASTGPATDPSTGPGDGPQTPTSSASPVDTAGTPDDRASGSSATGAGAGDATPQQDGPHDGGPGAATSGGADATVTRADAPDPDDTDAAGDEPGAAQAHRPSEDADDERDEQSEQEAEAEREQRLEEFAQEHDPEKHDIAAGEEFRQRGDWTADEAGGEQKWNADGELVEGSSPAVPESLGDGQSPSDTGGQSADDDNAGGDTGDAGGSGAEPAAAGTTGGRRTSSFEEIRDGGYSVGSAAPLDDGAMPMGHPVKGWEGSKTYAAPGDEKYDTGEPHVWFTDEGAAERAGFTRA